MDGEQLRNILPNISEFCKLPEEDFRAAVLAVIHDVLKPVDEAISKPKGRLIKNIHLSITEGIKYNSSSQL